MTPIPYVTEARQFVEDGRFYGVVKYGNTVIAEIKELADTGFKDAKGFDGWARAVALDHKDAISPTDTHVVTKSFTV